jgi:hypothetical protein
MQTPPILEKTEMMKQKAKKEKKIYRKKKNRENS